MGVRILTDRRDEVAVLYCSCTDWAFGPLIYVAEEDGTAEQTAQRFLDWFKLWADSDPRNVTDKFLSDSYVLWIKQGRPEEPRDERGDK